MPLLQQRFDWERTKYRPFQQAKTEPFRKNYGGNERQVNINYNMLTSLLGVGNDLPDQLNRESLLRFANAV